MELTKYKEKLADLTAKNPELGEAAAMLMSRSIQAGTKINELDYNEEPPEKLCFQIFNRTITIDTTIKHIVVQGDTNSRRITFELARYFDEIDLSTKQMRVYYINAEKKFGTTPIESFSISEEDESRLFVTWLVEGGLTTAAGDIAFALDFYEVDADDFIIYRWQTTAAHFNVAKAISALEGATEPDYRYQIDFISEFEGYEDYEELQAELGVEIEDRVVIMPSVENLVIQLDTMSRGIEYTMPRYFDGMDMSTKTIIIQYINAAGQTDCAFATNVKVKTDTISFTWIIDGKVTIKPGMVTYNIAFIGYHQNGKFYNWQTALSYIFVKDGILVTDGIDEPCPSWLHSLQIQIDSTVKKSMYYLNQTILMNEQIQEEILQVGERIEELSKLTDGITADLSTQIEEVKKATENAIAVTEAATEKLNDMEKLYNSIMQNTLSTIEIKMETTADIKQEYGNTVVGNVVSWSFSPSFTPASQELNGEMIDSSATSFEDLTIINEDKNYVLVVKDAIRTLSAKIGIKFYHSIRWCIATQPSDVAIADGSFLSAMDFSLQDNVRTILSVHANDGEYIWFACPHDISAGTQFYFSSVAGGFSLYKEAFPYENQYGYTATYDLYRSDNHSLGNVIVRIGNILYGRDGVSHG